MLTTLAVCNYRSLLDVVVPVGRLTVITGPNGSGKSNLYRALRLLAETAHDGVGQALAHDGGLGSALWAGPETISRSMRAGEVPVEGTTRRNALRLRLGFGGDDFGYAISLGLPAPSGSAFSRDPEIKQECVWAGPVYLDAAVADAFPGCSVSVEWNEERRLSLRFGSTVSCDRSPPPSSRTVHCVTCRGSPHC